MLGSRIGRLLKPLVVGLIVCLLSLSILPAYAQDLFITNLVDDSIVRYNGTTLTTFVAPGLNGIQSIRDMEYGPDGNLYVTSLGNNSIYQFDPHGNFLRIFATGGTQLSRQTFGPDGNLYVSDEGATSQVLRFNGQTGAYMGVFASGGGLLVPRGLKFGPDGNLYVVHGIGNGNGYVLRYNGTTGAFIDVFASGNNVDPIDIAFGPDNNLYVTDVSSHKVARYSGTTGESLGDFVTPDSGGLDVPIDLKFRGKYLYVASRDSRQVLRYNARTGAFVDVYYSGGSAFQPHSLLFAAHDPCVFDVDGDGHSDLVFQNAGTGQLAFWFMNSRSVTGGAPGTLTPAPGYKLRGTGDFNQDGNPDLVFQNSATGQIVLWYMSGTQVLGGSSVSLVPLSGYQIVAVGDFNRDGMPDLVLQNSSTGKVVVWFMNRMNVVSAGPLSLTPAPGYQVVGAGDFSQDGSADLVFQNSTTGQIALWTLNGVAVTGGVSLPLPGTGYKVVGVNSFSGSGLPDIAFQNSSTHQIVFWFMTGSTVAGGGAASGVPDSAYQLVGPR